VIRRRWTLGPEREARDAGADSGSKSEEEAEAETEAEAEGASSAQSNGRATMMAVVLDCGVCRAWGEPQGPLRRREVVGCVWAWCRSVRVEPDWAWMRRVSQEWGGVVEEAVVGGGAAEKMV
jgi:hypothetical protein